MAGSCKILSCSKKIVSILGVQTPASFGLRVDSFANTFPVENEVMRVWSLVSRVFSVAISSGVKMTWDSILSKYSGHQRAAALEIECTNHLKIRYFEIRILGSMFQNISCHNNSGELLEFFEDSSFFDAEVGTLEKLDTNGTTGDSCFEGVVFKNRIPIVQPIK